MMANRHGEEIMEPLQKFNFRVSNRHYDARHVLIVEVRSPGTWVGCGTVNNVWHTIELRGTEIVAIRGGGETGTCRPNILYAMSRELANYSYRD